MRKSHRSQQTSRSKRYDRADPAPVIKVRVSQAIRLAQNGVTVNVDDVAANDVSACCVPGIQTRLRASEVDDDLALGVAVPHVLGWPRGPGSVDRFGR